MFNTFKKPHNPAGEEMAFDSLMVFTGNANPEMAHRVAKHLDNNLGNASVKKFSDGEIAIELLENVRGRDVFILQSTCAPTNDNLMEILTMADALKRASAGRITAAIPYFGYARQDRRPRSARVPISAKLVANMLEAAGIDRVLTVDLHADQIQGFFNVPVDNIYATPILTHDIMQQRIDNLMVVSPDIGGVVRARAVAKMLNVDLAIIDKRRPKANVAEVMNIIGDVQGKTCLLIDDMIDTANTLCKAASALKERGIDGLFDSIQAAYDAAFIKMPTPKITRVLQSAIERQQPARAGLVRPKMRYAHQGGMNPPVIVIHGNSLQHIPDSYTRYLTQTFRKAFNLQGTPLRIQYNVGENPYEEETVKPKKQPPRRVALSNRIAKREERKEDKQRVKKLKKRPVSVKKLQGNDKKK